MIDLTKEHVTKMVTIDIPMPTDCYSCWIRQNMGCKIANESGWLNNGRDDKCPLREQEVRELTMDEWREWKNNPKRNPICELWEYDTSPMWVLNPNTIHEPALLMGKLKLFTGKPTFEQCKAVKWDE